MSDRQEDQIRGSVMRRFSLRDLLALILLCAMAAGWWADHRHQRNVMQKQLDHARREKLNLESKLRFLQAYNIEPMRPERAGSRR